MAYTKRQVVTVISIIFLGILTALAIYGISMIRQHALPVSTTLGGFIAVLPAIAGFSSIESALSGDRRSQRNGPQPTRYSLRTMITFIILTIYETVVVTLAGTHIGPVSGLNCRLDERWLDLFRNKDETIKRIQDAFNCCGLHSVKDKAWPFQAAKNPRPTCVEMFHRDKSCFQSWRNEEQMMGVVLLLVPILVFAWRVLVVANPTARTPWISRFTPGRVIEHDEEDGSSRRAISYNRVTEEFSDDPAGEAVNGETVRRSSRRGIENRPREPVNITQRSASTGDVNIAATERNEWAGLQN